MFRSLSHTHTLTRDYHTEGGSAIVVALLLIRAYSGRIEALACAQRDFQGDAQTEISTIQMLPAWRL